MGSTLIKKNILAITIVLLFFSIISLNYISLVNADSGYCYDQVGDGHHCFEKEKRCETAQRQDEMAESPCYTEIDIASGEFNYSTGF
jgi:hypothetical protein